MAVEAERLAAPGLSIAEVMSITGLAGSKGEAARLIKGGGVYVNDARVADERGRLTIDQAIDGRLFDDVQRRAVQERLVGEITARIRESLDVETVLKTAVREMRQSLGLDKISIHLEVSQE